MRCTCCGRFASEHDGRNDRGRVHFDCWSEHHSGPDSPWPPDHKCTQPHAPEDEPMPRERGGGSEVSATQDPRVAVDSYIVRPTCYEQMGNSDRDMFCLSVVNGHAWGWSVRQHGFSGSRALNRKGEWIYESRGSGHNKARRWSLEEALGIALKHVDRLKINGSTAADCAARWPVDPTDATEQIPDAQTRESEKEAGRG